MPNITAITSKGSLAWLTTVHRFSEYGAEAIALSSNTILVYLILTEKKKEYRDYRRVLLLNCIIDYLCTFVGIFLQPHFEILDGQWIYILSEPLMYFPKNAQMFIGGWYGWSNGFGLTTIPIQYYFRKCLICNGEKLTTWDLFKLTSISFLVSSTCGLLFFSCFYVSQGTSFPFQLLIDSGLIEADKYGELMNAEMTTLPMILVTLMATIANTTVLSMVLYFFYKIYAKLNELRPDMAPKTRQMQTQLNIMLAIQTISAFAIGVIPMLALVIIMATRINIIGAGTIISIFLAFVPVVNPICTLGLVGQFRRRFLVIIRISPLQITSNVGQESSKCAVPEKHTTFLNTSLI